jgi:hypothetical protein
MCGLRLFLHCLYFIVPLFHKIQCSVSQCIKMPLIVSKLKGGKIRFQFSYYSRASQIRTNWDKGMFGLVNFRIERVLQNTRGVGGGSEIIARSRVKVTTRGG